MEVTDLPTVNALLNFTSAVLIVTGVYCVRRKRIAAHRALMTGALVTSSIFLASYLIYHYNVGSVRFEGTGWIRGLYLAILLSHTVLAAVILPLVIRTVYLAIRERIAGHRRIARWTYPIWVYVSVTGVVVYWMLYRL